MEVCDMLVLQGCMEVKQFSVCLQMFQLLIDVMFECMEVMGKVVWISEMSEGCFFGSCKSCFEGKVVCWQEWWVL